MVNKIGDMERRVRAIEDGIWRAQIRGRRLIAGAGHCGGSKYREKDQAAGNALVALEGRKRQVQNLRKMAVQLVAVAPGQDSTGEVDSLTSP